MSNIPWAVLGAEASDAYFINSGSAFSAGISSVVDDWLREEPLPDNGVDMEKLLLLDSPGQKIEEQVSSINTNAPPPEAGIKPVEETLQLSNKELSINMQIQENVCFEQLAHEWLSLNGCPVSILEIQRVFTCMSMNGVKDRISVCGGGRRGIVRFLGYEFVPGLFNGAADHLMVECCVDNLVGGIGSSEASDKILESMEALINQGNASFSCLPISLNWASTSQHHHSSSFSHSAYDSLLEGALDPTLEAAETSSLIDLSTKAARYHRHGISKMKHISRMKLQSKMACASTSKREPKRNHISVPCRQKIQHSTSPMKIDNSNKRLTLLLQKELKMSDVSSLGRMVLPKKEAEAHLPALSAKDGMIIEMEDFEASNIWHLRYRFWPNNKTRMYVLENTKEFVRLHGLEAGDYMTIYEDERGKKVIKATKVVKALPLATMKEFEDAHTDTDTGSDNNSVTTLSHQLASVTDNSKNKTIVEDDFDDIYKELYIDISDISLDGFL